MLYFPIQLSNNVDQVWLLVNSVVGKQERSILKFNILKSGSLDFLILIFNFFWKQTWNYCLLVAHRAQTGENVLSTYLYSQEVMIREVRGL